jgi:hypothetical protein
MVGMRNVVYTVENSQIIPQKFKHKIILWLTISPTEYWAKKNEVHAYKNLDINVYRNINHCSQKVERTQISFDRWMDKQTVVHLYHGILFSHKKSELLIHTTIWMKPQNIMSNKRSHIENATYCMIQPTLNVQSS